MRACLGNGRYGEGAWEGGITQDHKEAFEGDKYIHYLNWSDGLRRYKHVKTHQIVHFQHVHFILC